MSALDRFQSMAGDIGRFMSESEKVFLDTGGKLQHLQNDANRLLTESSEATRMGDKQDNPAQRLRRGLDQLNDHLGKGQAETAKGLKALTSVLSGIQNLSGMDGAFQTIVATLHALASTTHLENSRRNDSQSSFDSVVNDLRSMATRIRPKFGEVLSKSREVRLTTESALRQAQTFLGRHRQDVDRLNKETRKELEDMVRACDTSYVLTDKSCASVSKVRASIGQVLLSMQIQDLVRQMFEHVVEDLQEFSNSARAALDQGGPDSDPRAWLAELAIVSGVGAAQISNACKRLVSGLREIDGNLDSVVTTLNALAKESASFSGKNTSTSVLRELERGIRATTQILRAHDVQEESMVKALRKVSETAAGIEELVDEVARLGRDAKFIGLNAMVKAVRVGQAGITLTVLAREIQDMSDQIETFTSSAANIMKSVGNESRQLVTRSSANGENTIQLGEVVIADLDRLLVELGGYQSALGAAVDRLLSGSATLRTEVASTSSSLQGLIGQATSLARLSSELTHLQRQATMDAAGAKPLPGRQHRENLRHTMEDERNVQRSVLGGKPTMEKKESADSTSAEGSIEFF